MTKQKATNQNSANKNQPIKMGQMTAATLQKRNNENNWSNNHERPSALEKIHMSSMGSTKTTTSTATTTPTTATTTKPVGFSDCQY